MGGDEPIAFSVWKDVCANLPTGNKFIHVLILCFPLSVEKATYFYAVDETLMTGFYIVLKICDIKWLYTEGIRNGLTNFHGFSHDLLLFLNCSWCCRHLQFCCWMWCLCHTYWQRPFPLCCCFCSFVITTWSQQERLNVLKQWVSLSISFVSCSCLSGYFVVREV